MVYLGINVSHGASAALMVDGKIILAFQEERFNNIKSFVGYPKKSIDACINYIKKNGLKIEHAAFSTIKNPVFPFKYPLDYYFSIKNWQDYYLNNFFSVNKKVRNTIETITKLRKIKKIDQYLNYNQIKKKDYFTNYKIFRDLQERFLLKQSEGLIKKISFIDHHTCHASYAAYAPNIKEKRVGILTIDSEGDGLNQTFWIYEKSKNKLFNVNKSHQCDIARIYRFITLILKMKPNEHEYKVMGMAPYAKNSYSDQVYDEVFKNLLQVKNCKVVHKNRPKNLFGFLYEKTKEHRFDNIAGGVQKLVEVLSAELIHQIYKKYKINSFSISGGVSMNIKMNGNIVKKPYVKNLYIPPTGTDESLSIGACYYLNRKENNRPLKNIYLGQNLSDTKITVSKLKKYLNSKKFKIQKNINHKNLAKLLNKGEIIAIVNGREEFGSRALGNRSIIADPSKEGVVKKINEQIKNRDFWMPFALTILSEDHKKFIYNPKSIRCDFMTIGYDTIMRNYLKIKNGSHPYDKTVRPQILDKKFNKDYNSIIKEFKKLSGIPALLNTSLNLHGFPISSNITQVIKTFKKSGIKYLYIENNFLIKKK